MKAKMKEKLSQESSLPKSWLLGSLVALLTVLATCRLPTAAAWMPLSRSSSFAHQQHLSFRSSSSPLAFLPSKTHTEASSKSFVLMQAKAPSDEEEEFEEYDEWEEIDYVDEEEGEEVEEEEEEEDEEIDDEEAYGYEDEEEGKFRVLDLFK